MKWLTNLFKRSQKALPIKGPPQAAPPRSPATGPPSARSSVIPCGESWYCSAGPDGKIRQVVLSLPISNIVPTEFGTLFLMSDKFPLLASQPWCAGLFRLDGRPGPFLMARVVTFAAETKSIPITLAFTFCHMPSSGLFHMAVRFDSKPFGQTVRKKISILPPIEPAIVEWITSLDSEYDKKMIGDAVALPQVRLVICENSNSSSSIMGPSGNWIEMIPPRASHDVVAPLETSLADCLQAEWQALVRHHGLISPGKKNFTAAQRELGFAMPVQKDPVLPRP